MPSIDEDLLLRLCASGNLVCFAEQNNGYILHNLLKVLYRRAAAGSQSTANVLAINTLDRDGRPQYIHSGTYEELTRAFGLSSNQIADAVMRRFRARSS
jgi:transketolase